MGTHNELGEISHNKEEEYDERKVVETPLDLDETIRSPMEELKSCKDGNERMIKEQEKKTEISAVLIQILSDIQRQLQHGPTYNHMDRHHTKKTQIPPESKSMVLKVATQGGSPQRRPNMEPRDIQQKNHMVRKLITPRDILVIKIVHIPREEERRGNIPRAMALKSLRNKNHPLSMEKLRRGKKQKFGYLA
jgi:hypothetical protein